MTKYNKIIFLDIDSIKAEGFKQLKELEPLKKFKNDLQELL